MGVRIETGGVDHELHEFGVAPGREELDGGLGGTPLSSGIGVWVVPVDVATVDEAANQSDGTVSERLGGGVPSRLLHLQHSRVFPPSTLGFGNEIGVRASARVDDTNGPGPVVILIGLVELRRGTVGVWDRTEVATRANSTVAAKSGEGSIGKVHSRGAEGVGINIDDVRLVGGDVPG